MIKVVYKGVIRSTDSVTTAREKIKILNRMPNSKCVKCGKLGRMEFYEHSGGTYKIPRTYARVVHEHGIFHYIGTIDNNIEFNPDKDYSQARYLQAGKKPVSLKHYRELIDDIVVASKILDEPGMRSIRPQLLHRLFWMLPVRTHESKDWQLEQYKKVVDNIVQVVKEMPDKKYSTIGKNIQPEFARVLQHWRLWKT
jgi:hypothetical protein